MLRSYQADYRLRSTVTEEDLSLALYDMLLEIVGYGFGGAEIFHCFRHLDTQIFAELEESVDSCTCREYDCSIIEDVDPLGAELS